MQLVLAILLLSPCALAFSKNNTHGFWSFWNIFELFPYCYYCEDSDQWGVLWLRPTTVVLGGILNANANVILLQILWKYHIQAWKNILLVLYHGVMRMDSLLPIVRSFVLLSFSVQVKERNTLAEVAFNSMSCEGFLTYMRDMLMKMNSYCKSPLFLLQQIW
jgi:hypothetical protein